MKMRYKYVFLVLSVLMILTLITSCSVPAPAPGSTPRPSPKPTATPSPVPSKITTPTPQKTAIIGYSEATTLVTRRIYNLATTYHGKQILAYLVDKLGSDHWLLVLPAPRPGGQVSGGWIVTLHLDTWEVEGNEFLKSTLTAEDRGDGRKRYYMDWGASADGSEILPVNSNAIRLEAELGHEPTPTKAPTPTPSQSPSSAVTPTPSTFTVSPFPFTWKYPQIKHLGVKNLPGQQTVPRKDLENNVTPEILEIRVANLVRDYAQLNPYVEPNHVCRHMAQEFWKILKNNNIKSVIVLGDTDRQNEWKVKYQCDHVWVVVLGQNGLNIAVECTNGTTISPMYMKTYEVECETAYQSYGLSSPEWAAAKDSYDRAYSKYAQYLEGYYYLDPTSFVVSTLFIPTPWGW